MGRHSQEQQAVRAGSLAASLRSILAAEWGPQPVTPLLGVGPVPPTVPRQPAPLAPAAAAAAAAAAAGEFPPRGASRTAAHIGDADDEDDIDDEVRCAWAFLCCSEPCSSDGERAWPLL